MTPRDGSSLPGHGLVQLGMALFLVALLMGLAIPHFAVPRLGLSVHLLGLMQGIWLMLIGLVWPRLTLSQRAARMACGLAVYGCLAAWTANLLGAIWGAGSALLPFAARGARGTPLQEFIIALGLRSGGIALIVAAALILWGLRPRPTVLDGPRR